ncbi:MAG: DUF1838 family protein [Rhodospirillaceae bacterium]
MADTIMKRRLVLGGLAGLGVGAPFVSSKESLAEIKSRDLDPKGRDTLGLLQRKLIYAADDRPLIWWLRGNKYGSINGNITPLWTLNVILFKKVVHGDDDTMDVTSMEIVYKTDVETDAYLNSWRNPYNGENYEEVPLIMGPLTRRFDNTGPLSQTALPGADIRRSGTLGPAEIAGDNVWLLSDVNVQVEREGQDSFRANDLSTYHGSVRDILNPELPSAPATMTTHIIQSWHPWMNMKDQEGTLITRISGAKCFKVDDMHPRLRNLVREYHPDIAKDFIARLDQPPERFDR